MTVTVLDSADLVQSVVTGVIPVPKGIAEDNAAQAAKKEGRAEAPPEPLEKPQEQPKPAEPSTEEDEDQEGEDGLTPRQKREFTDAMLKTIHRKHRAMREAEEFATTQYNQAQLAESRAEALERELARLKQQAKPEPVIEAKAPERKDFETDQAFEDARVDYLVDQRFKAHQAEEAQRRETARQQEIIAHAAARIERAIELVPDFKEVTESVDMAVPAYIAGYMQESEMFGELGYHFAKHPEVLQKLTELTPARALVEVGKIESTLTPFASHAKVENGEGHSEEPSPKNGTEPSRETGSAPSKPRVQAPIIRPLTSAGAAQVQKDEADMKSTDVIRSWQKKHGVQLTARKRH